MVRIATLAMALHLGLGVATQAQEATRAFSPAATAVGLPRRFARVAAIR